MCRIVLFIFLVTLANFESQAKTIQIKSCLPLQEQMNEADAEYLITDIIDLGGNIVNVPVNSTLQFNRRGVLKNGTIYGNGTRVSGEPKFDGIRLTGSFANQIFLVSWCSTSSMSDYIEDVMNLGGESAVVVDCDILLDDKRKYVDHLSLIGKNTTITNSDRYYITYGGTSISDLKFRWNKPPVQEPKDNYSAVVVYWNLLHKDTTIITSIKNVDADGGRYNSFFMKQYKSSIEPKLTIVNDIENCQFKNFTCGAIWTCGGTGEVSNTRFTDIGYDQSNTLKSVTALRLGLNNKTIKGRAVGYIVKNCLFQNIVAPYNGDNDGRELHGLLVYGDSVQVRNNQFKYLSTSFHELTDTGMDSEILYFKGSGNVIENNFFEDGAGSISDGILTLKSTPSEGNIVRNNQFLTTVTTSKYIYIGGRDVVIDGNNFQSIYSIPSDKEAYAIYLAHHAENIGSENAVIQNNTFSFNSNSGYMAVYASGWGNLELRDNYFFNPSSLLKCNKRHGTVIVQGNVVKIDSLRGNIKNDFIMISLGGRNVAKIEDNSFTISHTVMGRLVTGTNYQFGRNKVFLRQTKMKSMLCGVDTLNIENNTIMVDGKRNNNLIWKK